MQKKINVLVGADAKFYSLHISQNINYWFFEQIQENKAE